MIMNASAIVVYVAVALASFPGWPPVSPFTPRGECFQTLDRQADDAPGVTLKEGESFDFRFDGLDYQRKQSILPQVVVYFGKGVGQIEEGRHFAYRLFSDDFTDGTLTGWTPNLGTWTNPGTYMHGDYTLGNAWNVHSSTGSDFVYTGTVNLLSGNAVGLVFRSSADGTSSYDVILDAVDNVFKISMSQPYQVLVSSPMVVQRNHPYTIKVVANGSMIEAYLDGVKLLTATDSTYSSGYFGVILFRSTATYDDLWAQNLP